MTKGRQDRDMNRKLTRAMWMHRIGGPTGIVVTLVVLAIFVVVFMQFPLIEQHRTAEVRAVTPLVTDYGIRQHISVTLDGESRTLVAPTQLTYPAPGETVCLRETIYWPVGRKSLAITNMDFCDGSFPTSQVD